LRSIEEKPLVEALFTRKPLGKNQVLLAYYGNLRYGFVIGLNIFDSSKLIDYKALSKVYDNYYVLSLTTTS